MCDAIWAPSTGSTWPRSTPPSSRSVSCWPSAPRIEEAPAASFALACRPPSSAGIAAAAACWTSAGDAPTSWAIWSSGSDPRMSSVAAMACLLPGSPEGAPGELRRPPPAPNLPERPGGGQRKQAVVVRAGRAPEGVAREHPQPAVRGDRHVAKPAVPVVQQPLRSPDRGLHRDAPERLALERGHVHRPTGTRDPARGGVIGRPLDERVDVCRVAGSSLDARPAVVAALLDLVELVPGVLAELAGVHRPVGRPREALDVAVAVGPDRVAERVAGRRPAIGR